MTTSKLSGDAGLLPNGPFDRRRGLIHGFRETVDNPRDPQCSEFVTLSEINLQEGRELGNLHLCKHLGREAVRKRSVYP
jgi:hypothetical protein